MSVPIRRWILFAHRWIGVTSSLLLLVVGGTGGIIVWRGEGFLRKVAGRLHENLALGSRGHQIVLAATIALVLLELSGVVLWWRRRSMAVRWHAGWRDIASDIHHPSGILGTALVLLFAITAIGMAWVPRDRYPGLGPRLVDLHSARNAGWVLHSVYFVGAVCLTIQGISGVVMWWSRRPPRRRLS